MNSIQSLKLSETETVIPRVDLTGPTPTAPVAIQAYMPCSAKLKPATVSRRVKKAKYYHICPQTCLCILQFTPEMLY